MFDEHDSYFLGDFSLKQCIICFYLKSSFYRKSIFALEKNVIQHKEGRSLVLILKEIIIYEIYYA